MIGDRVFDEFPLSRVEDQRRFGHERSGCLLEVSIWREKLAWLCDPAAFVAGKPTAVRGPSQEIGEWFILRNPPRISETFGVSYFLRSRLVKLVCRMTAKHWKCNKPEAQAKVKNSFNPIGPFPTSPRIQRAQLFQKEPTSANFASASRAISSSRSRAAQRARSCWNQARWRVRILSTTSASRPLRLRTSPRMAFRATAPYFSRGSSRGLA